MTPREFDGWLAYWEIEPDVGRGLWRIREILKQGFAATCAAWGLKLKPAYFDPVREEEDVAGGTNSEAVSPAQAAQMVSMVAGAPLQRE